MSDQRIDLSPSGPPDSILPAEPEAARALEAALASSDDDLRSAVGAVVARWPRYVDAWARLGELSTEPIESYAYFRIGYHRGLDALRASGWRGTGYVRWKHETNRGFLRALLGLRAAALLIEEHDEVERIGEFLKQLDPELEF